MKKGRQIKLPNECVDPQVLKGKRLAGIDFGLKRIGVSVCDELHISITPKKVFDYKSSNFWGDFIKFLKEENISALVVGVPYRYDNKETDVLSELRLFIESLKKIIEIPIFEFDENFTTIRATELMIDLGKKKKDRRRKESKDLIASGLILRDFIEVYNL